MPNNKKVAEVGSAIKQYLTLRDVDLVALRKEFKEKEMVILENMEALEQRFVLAFNKQIDEKEYPTTSISTKVGAAYRDVRTSTRVTDAAALRAWVLEDPENRLQYMTAAVAKVEFLKFLEAEGKYKPTTKDEALESFDAEPIPGVTISKKVHVKFSKAKGA